MSVILQTHTHTHTHTYTQKNSEKEIRFALTKDAGQEQGKLDEGGQRCRFSVNKIKDI